MKITYTNQIEDLIALAQYVMARNPTFQFKHRLKLYFNPLIVLGVFALVAIDNSRPVFYLVGLAGALLCYFWASSLYTSRAIEKRLRKDPLTEVLCAHTVSITADGLSEETEGAWNYADWNQLHRIFFTADYVFVLGSPTRGLLIPRRELGDSQFQDVTEEIRKHRPS